MTDPFPEMLNANAASSTVRYPGFVHGRLYSRLQGVVGLVAVFLLALIFSPHSVRGGLIFLEPGNITDILRQVSLIGIISLGMTFVILTGGIDLSVGSVLALASSIAAFALTRLWLGASPSIHIFSAAALAVAVCGAAGAVNGLVVARLGVQPFIVTLAAM